MQKRTLLMDVKVGQSVSIDGGRIVLTLEAKSGQLAKLRFEHDGVPIERVGTSKPAGSSGARQAIQGIGLKAA